MRILFFGTSTFALPALQALIDHQYPLAGVVTQPDRPAGRGGKLTPPPVKVLAAEYDVPVLQPASCRDAAFLTEARALAPDLSVVAAYGQFLPDDLLYLPRFTSVNLHGSLLPKYRGAAPIQRALWAGETTTGVCLMWMARAMDAGDVIACSETPILPSDTAGTLGERLARLGADLLPGWLPAIEQGTAPRLPQDPAAVTFAPPIRKEERPIDWRQPATAIWRQIRALAPQPGATAAWRGQPLKVLAARPMQEISSSEEGEPGAIVEISAKSGIAVATGAGFIELTTLQPAGKRPMTGADFQRGYHIVVGESFTCVTEDSQES